MSFRSLQILSVLLVAATAGAETLSLTLDDAVGMALGRGTRAALARSAEERARIARTEALSGMLPQVDARLSRYSESINLATFGFSISGQPTVVGPFNVVDGQIAAAMQIFNLAAIRHYQAVQQSVSASQWETQQAENDVAAAVARLYLLVRRAQTQVGSREADVTLFERLLKMADDEFTAGTGTRLDVAQARVQLARARQALLAARNDRQNAALALLNAIGADEANDVAIAELPAPPPAIVIIDIALSEARANRPELKAMAAREKEASLAYSAQRARLVPNVALDFTGDMNGNRADDLHWTRRIAGVLGVPLFRGDINASIARARVALHEIEIERLQRERDVEQEVRRALFALQNAQERLSVARESARVAEEALTVAGDRRAAGYGSPVEVDRAQDVYRQAREDVIAAEADAAAAQFDLEHATGGIRRLVAQRLEVGR